MAVLLRSLCLGFGLAALAGQWLAAGGDGWISPLLTIWFGGAVLTLGIVALGTWRRPAAAPDIPTAPQGVFTVTEAEIQAWASDLAKEDSAVLPDYAPGTARNVVAHRGIRHMAST